MIKFTIINKKDTKKYLIKFIIICFLLFIIIKIMNNIDKINLNALETKEYLFIINKMIPGINKDKIEINTKENIENILKSNNDSIFKVGLKLELGVFDNLVKKDEKTIKNIDEKENIKENNNENNNRNNNDNNVENVEQAELGLTTTIVPNNVPDKYTNTYNGVKVKNTSDYNLTEDDLKPDISFDNKNVLIFHTHTCESYTASEKYNYVQTGTYRTTDFEYNVVRVGTELENQLKSYNFNVIHDKTYHDYPAYNGSYSRSLETVQNILNNNKDIDIVFDIHRDAIADYSYAPKVKIGDEYASQIMFVIGTDGGGSKHDNWRENLKFAVKVEEKANELYPGLFKAILLRNSRYNQHVAKAACIIEVGATGNTLDECLNSMKYLAKVLSEVIK